MDFIPKEFTGFTTKDVTIFSDDPRLPELKVIITADVYRAFELIPKFVSFERTKVGKATTAEVTIHNHSDNDATIIYFRTSKPGISCSLKDGDIIHKKEDRKVTFTFIPTEEGSLESEIFLGVSHPEERIIKILSYGVALKE